MTALESGAMKASGSRMSAASAKKKGRGLILLAKLSLPVALLILWQVWSLSFDGGLPPPTDVLIAFFEALRDGSLLTNIGASLGRVFAGYALSVVIGVPLGLAMGYSIWFERAFGTLVEGLRPIPASAWVPISIVLMGVGERPAIFLVFIGTVWAVIINSVQGVRSVPKHLVWAARTMGATRRQIFFKVIFPEALPSVLTAMRIGVGIAFTNVIVAELIAVRSGLGYMITEARLVMRPDLVLAGMLAIGVVGYLLDLAVRLALRHALQWQQGLVTTGKT
jgi:NitT/TauT family transport system permease protein